MKLAQEAYCSLEVSKLLKEKGFDVITNQTFDSKQGIGDCVNFFMYYADYTNLAKKFPDIYKSKIEFGRTTTNSSIFTSMEANYKLEQVDLPYYNAPTLYVASEWVRLNFGIYIEVCYSENESQFFYNIIKLSNSKTGFTSRGVNYFSSPKDALECGIAHSLKEFCL